MKTNAIIAAWISGCQEIRKIWGGYDFIWLRSDGSTFHKILQAGKVTNRLHAADGKLLNEAVSPIDIGVKDIVVASMAIKKSGKLTK